MFIDTKEAQILTTKSFKDFVFVSKTLSEKDEKAFSDFLKQRKSITLKTKDKKKYKELQNQ